MNYKIVTAILVLSCVVLTGVGAVGYLGTDRMGPEITIPEGIISYTEGADTAVLLNDISAYDKVDKDVTDSIRIAEIIPMGDGQKAKIVYVAKDKNNNITREERVVEYTPKDPVQSPEPTGEAEDEEEPQELTPNGKSDPAGTVSDWQRDQTSVGEQDSLYPQNTKVEENGDISNLDDSELVSTGAPVIRLRKYKVHLKAGEQFQFLSYVDKTVDDKDDVSTRIEVTGDYDTSVPGSYELKYSTTDLEGNKSNIETLTLVVE